MRIVTCLAAALLALPASAAVTVDFVKPEQYTDFPRSEYERAPLLQELSKEFVRLGAKLPAGQDLAITVDDVDLAGRMEWTRLRNQALRILTGGADWPRIQLHYVLQADGKTIRSGEANLSDMDYLNRADRWSSGATLRYEKTMLDAWFGQTFGDGAGR